MMRKTIHILLSACLLSSGCTDVELGGTAEVYGTRSLITVTPDWSGSGLTEYERPDSLTVVMQRTLDLTHVWTVCDNTGVHPTDSVILSNGEWIVVAMDPTVENVTFTGLREFLTDSLSSIKNITGAIDTLTAAEVISRRGILDPNPGMPYYEEVHGLVCGYEKTSVNGAKENDIRLTMQDMSCPVTFNLRIHIEGDVRIESILGEVSGVPGSVNVMSREAVASRTGKTMFDIGQLSGDTTSWTGSARIVGIVSPQEADCIVGDGILCVRLTVVSGGHRMLFIASLNLKTLLDGQPLLTVTDRYNVYRCVAAGEFTFDIPTTLRLTPDGVAPGDDGSGVGGWVNQAKIDGGV